MAIRRLIGVACCAMVVLAIASTGSVASADPPVSLVTCSGTAEQTYDPGLVLATRDTRIVSTITFTCTDADPAPPTVTSAVISVDYTTPASCLVSPPLTSTTLDVEWNDGQHSIVPVTVVVSRTTGTTVVAATGTVASGLFTGQRLTDEIIYTNPDLLACLLGGGVTQVSGTAELVMTPI